MMKARVYYSVFYGCVSAFLCVISTGLNAQQERSITIDASATIVGNIELETVRNMVFKNTSMVTGLAQIDPAKNAEAGKLIARGIQNEPFSITFFSKLVLRNIETGDVLNVTYRVTGFPSDEQSASVPLEAIEQELKFNENGEFYFWIGAQVDISNAAPGNYTGEFTFELEYNE